MRLSRLVCSAVVLLALLCQAAWAPSAGASAAAIVYGTGRYTTPVPSHTAASDWSGTAAGVFGTTAGQCSMAMSLGGDEGTATAFGTGMLTCYGVSSVSCVVSYARTGTVVTLTGGCSSASIHGSLTAVFVLVPTSLNVEPTEIEASFPTFAFTGTLAIV